MEMATARSGRNNFTSIPPPGQTSTEEVGRAVEDVFQRRTSRDVDTQNALKFKINDRVRYNGLVGRITKIDPTDGEGKHYCVRVVEGDIEKEYWTTQDKLSLAAHPSYPVTDMSTSSQLPDPTDVEKTFSGKTSCPQGERCNRERCPHSHPSDRMGGHRSDQMTPPKSTPSSEPTQQTKPENTRMDSLPVPYQARDLVRVYSTSQDRWFDDGEVQSVKCDASGVPLAITVTYDKTSGRQTPRRKTVRIALANETLQRREQTSIPDATNIGRGLSTDTIDSAISDSLVDAIPTSLRRESNEPQVSPSLSPSSDPPPTRTTSLTGTVHPIERFDHQTFDSLRSLNAIVLFGDNDRDKTRRTTQQRGGWGGQASVAGYYDRIFLKDQNVTLAYGIVTTFWKTRTLTVTEYNNYIQNEIKLLTEFLKSGGHILYPAPSNVDILGNPHTYFVEGKQRISHNLGTGIASMTLGHALCIEELINSLKKCAVSGENVSKEHAEKIAQVVSATQVRIAAEAKRREERRKEEALKAKERRERKVINYTLIWQTSSGFDSETFESLREAERGYSKVGFRVSACVLDKRGNVVKVTKGDPRFPMSRTVEELAWFGSLSGVDRWDCKDFWFDLQQIRQATARSQSGKSRASGARTDVRDVKDTGMSRKPNPDNRTNQLSSARPASNQMSNTHNSQRQPASNINSPSKPGKPTPSGESEDQKVSEGSTKFRVVSIMGISLRLSKNRDDRVGPGIGVSKGQVVDAVVVERNWVQLDNGLWLPRYGIMGQRDALLIPVQSKPVKPVKPARSSEWSQSGTGNSSKPNSWHQPSNTTSGMDEKTSVPEEKSDGNRGGTGGGAWQNVSHESANPKRGAKSSKSKYRVGEKVEGRVGNKWHVMKVTDIGADGRYGVQWDDGSKFRLAVDKLRLPMSTKLGNNTSKPTPSKYPDMQPYRIGDKLMARDKSAMPRPGWFPVTVIELIAHRKRGHQITVQFDDSPFLYGNTQTFPVDSKDIKQRTQTTQTRQTKKPKYAMQECKQCGELMQKGREKKCERCRDSSRQQPTWQLCDPVEVYSESLSKWIRGQVVFVDQRRKCLSVNLLYPSGRAFPKNDLPFSSSGVRRPAEEPKPTPKDTTPSKEPSKDTKTRKRKPSQELPTEVRWQWDNNGEWVSYPIHISHQLDKALERRKTIPYKYGFNNYTLDPVNKVQINDFSKEIRKIRPYVQLPVVS